MDHSPAFGQADLTNCERELIHLAGSIQPHGALLVLRAMSAIPPVGMWVAGAGALRFGIGVVKLGNHFIVGDQRGKRPIDCR